MKYKHHGNDTYATAPGNVTLSLRKLWPFIQGFKYQFGLLEMLKRFKAYPLSRLREHLLCGDTQPAVVCATTPQCRIAVYSEDMDAIVMLAVSTGTKEDFGLQVGDRLLSINTYEQWEEGHAQDIILGDNYQNWCNFYPLIADFLSNDYAEIEAKKATIPEDYWGRLNNLAKAYMINFPDAKRSANPYRSDIPHDLRATID